MNASQYNNNEKFRQQMKKKILILDGAMGTMIQNANLTAEDFGGLEYEGCNELLNLTNPNLIRDIHEEYLTAGADIIETNTFGASSIVLAEYSLEEKVEELNLLAAKLAKEAVAKFTTEEWPRFVAGSMGPTTKTLSITGGVSFEQMVESYYQQARALIIGGVDLLLLETAQDTLNVKAGGIGIKKAFTELDIEIPIMISGTIEAMGTTLAGQNIEAFYISLEHLNPISVGLNCATGPEFMRDHIRTLSNLSSSATSCYPNAGLPDEDGHYHESPKELAEKMANFAKQGWLNIAGGCCGTTPEHIKEMAHTLKNIKPRLVDEKNLQALSGIEPLILEKDNRPILVGERTNVIGSKKFRDLIVEGKYEEASELGRVQVKKGAQVIDICLANPDRDELSDIKQFLSFIVKKVKVPLMIDSTDSKVVEESLKFSQGKAIINSINLEDGEKRFEELASLIKKYGASVVVGTIDEKGMATSRDRKLAVAKRSYELLVHKYSIPPQDIIFDPLVFPVGTGDDNYIGSAVETIEGIRLIKRAFPKSQTILGISNVSFGLPATGREVINAVFLYHATLAGLDYAIVNTEKLQRYASISNEEQDMAEKVLFQTDDQILTQFTNFYRDKKVTQHQEINDLSLEGRLSRYIVEGLKDGLYDDLQEAQSRYAPLDIINGPLMQGMEEVGRLFNKNQLIVAEVLQSAEVMKAAVSYLEPFMDKKDTALNGKIMLATVKGDVHDIGKNLVEIILANNGYDVINLGIKVAPEQLIEACKEEKPDYIGLSGLLVKSAQQMATTAQDLKAAGIDIPLIVGGAALTRKFTETRITPEYTGPVLYAKDAMNGLELLNKLKNSKIDNVKHKDENNSKDQKDQQEGQNYLYESKINKIVVSEQENNLNNLAISNQKSELYNKKHPVYIPKQLEQQILLDYPLEKLKPYINMQMLMGKHLGLKGNVENLLAEGDNKAVELKEMIDLLLTEAIEKKFIKANGVYQFFPAQSKENEILIYDHLDYSKVIQRFSFPRQMGKPYLSLADYLRPVESGEMDYVGFLVVSTGGNIQQLATNWRDEGEYLRSHLIQALALELAEAFAEKLHHIMREEWGIGDTPLMTMAERFAAKYQGMRVSFGYPACPNLEDQRKLFTLLNPEQINVNLTEGFMMEPEASVSAMVFSHPKARYFQV